VDAAHEIFKKPLPVEMAWESVPTPKNYLNWPEGASLGETMKVWKLFGKLEQRDYGLVSDPYGFTDSPDCETISSGINSKSPQSVALGRQGNFFLWGFCAPPSAMTDPARRAFVNAVVYMKRFDGQRPLVSDPVSARDWTLVFARFLSEGTSREYILKQFAEPLRKKEEAAPADFAKFLQENRGWLRYDRGTKTFDVDEDAKSLGVANHDVALLDACVTMLEKDDRADLAKKLLARYVEAKPGDDAKSWRAWLDANRAKLYFTDRGGYLFRVRP
jgi:hypothetical protein